MGEIRRMPQADSKKSTGDASATAGRNPPISMKQAIHDMRIPLNHILGYSEILIEDLEEADGATVFSSLCEVVRSVSRRLHDFSARISNGCSAADRATLQAELEDFIPSMRSILDRLNQIPAMSAAIRQGVRKLGVGVDSFASAVAQLSVAIPIPSDGMSLPAGGPAEQALVAEEAPIAAGHTSVNEPMRPPRTGHLLVVEDDVDSREILYHHLRRQGYDVQCAANGDEGLALLRGHSFDLVLLDQMMPGMDGMSVLHEMRQDLRLKRVPVIMITGVDEVHIAVSFIEEGVEDVINKPFDPLLLCARVGALLERKQLRDRELKKSAELENAFREIENQKRIAERLLLNILPVTVAAELRLKGSVDPMYFEDVTIVMTDFVGFTHSVVNLPAEELVVTLNEYFTGFDHIVRRYRLEKLKTVGDSYIFVGGLPTRSPSHPVDSLLAAMEMIAFVEQRAATNPTVQWRMRVGAHTGPVIAGVVGVDKFAFDIWGDTINFCSRLEAASEPGRLNISGKTYSRVKDFFQCQPRGKVETKEGAEVDMYFVDGILSSLGEPGTANVPQGFMRRYQVYFRKEPHAFPSVFPGHLPACILPPFPVASKTSA